MARQLHADFFIGGLQGRLMVVGMEEWEGGEVPGGFVCVPIIS